MHGTVLFWKNGGWLQDEAKPWHLIMPSISIAENLDVLPGELQLAFDQWAKLGCKKFFQYKLEPKKYIAIQYDPDVYVLDGVIYTERPWGNHWRGLSKNRYSFTIEAIRI